MKKTNKKYSKKETTTLRKETSPLFDFDSYFKPLEVQVFNNFDRAFKTFRSLVQADGVLAVYKEKQAYEKPSVKKRRKQAETMQRLYEEKIKAEKVASGEYEKEKIKKEAKKQKRRQEREARKPDDVG
jgi:ribosomal protein S21